MKSHRHVVPSKIGRIRLVDYCPTVFKGLSTKSATKKALKRREITINGRIANGSEFVLHQDIIIWSPSPPKRPKKLHIDIEILYQDDHLIVINKPAGIATNGNRFSTVENAIMGLYTPSSAEDALARPMSVHRLDVPTRGVLLLAKSRTAQIELGRQFQQRQVQKTYHAIVHGTPQEQGIVQRSVDQKSAKTHYKLIRSVPSRVYQTLSLVEMRPITGRKHQLRVHMQSLGHLIVGDKMYSEGQQTILGKGLFLAATGISFYHPLTGKPEQIKIAIPPKFEKLLDREEART